MPRILWDDENSRAWVVGYADNPIVAKKILDQCRRNRGYIYYARIQIVGVELKKK